MFQHGLLDDLRLLYQCFRRDESTLSPIIARMNPYIVKRGESIVNDEVNREAIEFTRKLIDLKGEMDKMVEYSFGNDMKF